MLVDKTRIDWTHGHPLAVCFAEGGKKKGGRKSPTTPLFHLARKVFLEIPVLLFGREYVASDHSTTKLNARLKSASYLPNLPLRQPSSSFPTLLLEDSSGIRPRLVVIATITPPIQPRMLLNFCPSNPRSLGIGNVLQEDD